MGTKSHLQIATEICEPIRSENFNRLSISPKLYEGRIAGKVFKRSSHWWALYRSEVDKKPFGKELVNSRVNKGWTELQATSTPSGGSRRIVTNMLRDIEKIDMKEKAQAVKNNFLYGARS